MKVKICGFTVPEHIADAAGMGADYAGLVFWGGSPRVILSLERAEELAGYARGVGMEAVGVFVDEAVDRVLDIARRVRLDVVQLHGPVEEERIAAVVAAGFRVWQAIRTGADFSLVRAREAWMAGAELLVVDAGSALAPGGSGELADWAQAAAVAAEGPILLAGGLDAANVGRAIDAVRPWGVDVSSSLEDYPGFKDHFKMRAFLEAARRGSRP